MEELVEKTLLAGAKRLVCLSTDGRIVAAIFIELQWRIDAMAQRLET